MVGGERKSAYVQSLGRAPAAAGPTTLTALVRLHSLSGLNEKRTHTHKKKKSEEKTKAKRILKIACLKHTQHDVLQQKTINDTNHYTEISTREETYSVEHTGFE